MTDDKGDANMDSGQAPQLADNPSNALPNATFLIQPPEAFNFSKPQDGSGDLKDSDWLETCLDDA